MLFFEALKLGYLIHLHPLDNAHAEHTTPKSPVSLSTCRAFTAERGGLEPFINETINIVCKCIASALQMLDYSGFTILQTKIK